MPCLPAPQFVSYLGYRGWARPGGVCGLKRRTTTFPTYFVPIISRDSSVLLHPLQPAALQVKRPRTLQHSAGGNGEAANVREWRRRYDRATRLPTRLVEKFQRVRTHAREA